MVDKLLLVIIAIFIPPLAVYLHQNACNQTTIINLILTILFFLPGRFAKRQCRVELLILIYSRLDSCSVHYSPLSDEDHINDRLTFASRLFFTYAFFLPSWFNNNHRGKTQPFSETDLTVALRSKLTMTSERNEIPAWLIPHGKGC